MNDSPNFNRSSVKSRYKVDHLLNHSPSHQSSFSPNNLNFSTFDDSPTLGNRGGGGSVKKKAVFKEYIQSRDQLDVPSATLKHNRFVMPIEPPANRRGQSMFLKDTSV